MSNIWTLCIDFGTAYSKAAAAPRDAWAHFEPDEVRPLMLAGAGAGNPFLLDSAVFVDEGQILLGQGAVARAAALAHQKRAALKSFKTLLSVSDLDRALNARAPASVDPHRLFILRDLIVLYLAFLLAAITRAIAADPALAGAKFVVRYAAPAWRGGDGAGQHANVLRLFGEAHHVRRALGSALADGGISIEAAQVALEGARGAPPSDMGLIFEATAAAAYTSIGLGGAPSHLIVVDMGAGTTDFAALAGASGRISELPESRVTLKRAGDFIDGIIANAALENHKGLRAAQRDELWRTLMRDMRDLKETLFAEGQAAYRFEGRAGLITMRTLTRDEDFQAFLASVQEAYEHSFAALRERAIASGRKEILAVAVGGGAAAPFVQELIRRKPPRSGGIKLFARPATPEWAHAPAFRGNLAPVFPQLAIALGGALAPESMLAARAQAIPDAAARTGSRSARD